jgi:hypothetical protein
MAMTSLWHGTDSDVHERGELDHDREAMQALPRRITYSNGQFVAGRIRRDPDLDRRGELCSERPKGRRMIRSIAYGEGVL